MLTLRQWDCVSCRLLTTVQDVGEVGQFAALYSREQPIIGLRFYGNGSLNFGVADMSVEGPINSQHMQSN